MLTQQDLQQIAAKGIAEEQLQKQMDDFKRGFPFLRLDSAATVGHGILAPTDAARSTSASGTPTRPGSTG